MKKYYQFRVFALIFLSLKIFANDTEILEISMGNTKSLETKILDFDFDLKPKNIIFLIGDGTGFNAIHLARLHKGGPSHKLNIDNLPYVGIVNNHSVDNIYTDSAAAGTAFATGYKTNNKMLSITKDNRKLETITETLTKSGYIFGLVATSSITHATPAAFYSHVDSRYKEKIIADQLVNSDFSIALGGGEKYFKIKNLPNNISLIKNKEDLLSDKSLEFDRILGLFSNGAIYRSSNLPTQLEMTKFAVNFLSLKSKNGFFLMSEGSQIDWGGHANDADYMLREFYDFDQTIGYAIDYVNKNKDTLLVITTDHATGGLVIHSQDDKNEEKKILYSWATKKHNITNVGVYAYGPGAHLFSGTMDNTDIYKKMLEALNK